MGTASSQDVPEGITEILEPRPKGRKGGRIKLWSRLPVPSLDAHTNTSNIRDEVEQSHIKAPLC